MRTTTLALLSGAAMSISAASIYNATPAGGFRGEMLASLELPELFEPRLAIAADADSAANVAALPTATALLFAGAAAATAFDEPAAAAVAIAPSPGGPAQFVAVKPTKSAPGWRAHKNPKPAFDQRFLEPQPQQRVVMRQEPPPQMARPMSTAASFQSAPSTASFAAPARSPRPMSTSVARPASSF